MADPHWKVIRVMKRERVAGGKEHWIFDSLHGTFLKADERCLELEKNGIMARVESL